MPISTRIAHRGMTIPTFIYGTAWKEDRTEALTALALAAGFRAIDTANQRRHYYEIGVGEALRKAWDAGTLKREDLFLQTKFTYTTGQDHRLPYDPKADFPTQVMQSFASSLEHLHTSYIDSYVLHGPQLRRGLTAVDWQVWRALEGLQKSGAAKSLGVSNVSAEQLRDLLDKAEIKPGFVQNRCYASTQWDAKVRELCHANDVRYQGFSLLTANAADLERREIHEIAQRRGCTVARVVFRFALQIGMLPLTGTSDAAHMKEDLGAYDIELNASEMELIENVAGW